MRPLFAYLGALVNLTSVFAATEDWGSIDAVDSGLAPRIERTGAEFAALVAGRPAVAPAGFSASVFAELLNEA